MKRNEFWIFTSQVRLGSLICALEYTYLSLQRLFLHYLFSHATLLPKALNVLCSTLGDHVEHFPKYQYQFILQEFTNHQFLLIVTYTWYIQYFKFWYVYFLMFHWLLFKAFFNTEKNYKIIPKTIKEQPSEQNLFILNNSFSRSSHFK